MVTSWFSGTVQLYIGWVELTWLGGCLLSLSTRIPPVVRDVGSLGTSAGFSGSCLSGCRCSERWCGTGLLLYLSGPKKCSMAEIELKKRQALERRRQHLQGPQSLGAPTRGRWALSRSPQPPGSSAPSDVQGHEVWGTQRLYIGRRNADPVLHV